MNQTTSWASSFSLSLLLTAAGLGTAVAANGTTTSRAALRDAAPVADARGGPSLNPLADGLLQYLGFSSTDRSVVLEKGGVLHSGLIKDKQYPEEVAAVGAMLLVNAVDVDAVIDAFLHADTFHEVHQITRHKVLMPGKAGASAFADLRFASGGEIERIVNDPLRLLNLSRGEAGAFRSSRGAADAGARVARAMADVLAARLASFYGAGISGIVPYERSRGEMVRPGGELESALGSLSVLAKEYPGFLQNLRSIRPGPEVTQQYFRLEAPFEGTEVIALSRELRQNFTDRAIGADMHFYASRGYNAMLTIVGVAPYDKRWLVFAINHTFTDEVTGFASDIKRSVARKEIAGRLAKHLETVRGKLRSSGKTRGVDCNAANLPRRPCE